MQFEEEWRISVPTLPPVDLSVCVRARAFVFVCVHAKGVQAQCLAGIQLFFHLPSQNFRHVAPCLYPGDIPLWKNTPLWYHQIAGWWLVHQLYCVCTCVSMCLGVCAALTLPGSALAFEKLLRAPPPPPDKVPPPSPGSFSLRSRYKVSLGGADVRHAPRLCPLLVEPLPACHHIADRLAVTFQEGM